MRVGNQDLLLPTTMVGNYPNPRWYDGHAFAQYPKGTFVYDAISREAFEDAVLAIVHDQEAAGLDIISDGKVYGGDTPYGTVIYHYMERMSGYKMSGPQLGLPIYSTLYAPTCIGEIRREHPFHLANLRAVRKATKKPVKISYNGINVLAAASHNQHYKEVRDLAADIARAFHEDFLQLADEGVDIIQTDEFLWPYGMNDWETEVYNLAVDDVPGVQFWTHICWGNYGGTPGYLHDEGEREYDAWVLDQRGKQPEEPPRARNLFPTVAEAHQDVLNWEVGRTGADDLKPLVGNWDKPFVAGIIDVKNLTTESAEEVADRIRQCLEYVPAEKLGLTTDCGMVNMPRMICQNKLRALADGAAIVREELSKAQ